jgi:leucyl-tRNA synthetase
VAFTDLLFALPLNKPIVTITKKQLITTLVSIIMLRQFFPTRQRNTTSALFINLRRSTQTNHHSTSSNNTLSNEPITTKSILENEKKWQDRWRNCKKNETISTDKNESFYVLPMFPYPSGNLHMGHVRVYTISDCLARYRRLNGFNVMHPIGWDAFGLPAENAARQNNVEPSDWTIENIERMKNQLLVLGFDFDWDREVTTCKDDYYRWTQWLFTELYDAGLAYREEAVVNWDPVDCTVLANEQIDADGRSWRSGALAERKRLNQWFFKITDYADELLEGLDTLEQWPEQVKQMQRNWIGQSKGTEIHFQWPNNLSKPTTIKLKKGETFNISIFTTRVDTLMGVTFIAVAFNHPIVAAVLEHEPDSDVFANLNVDELAALVDAVTNNTPPPAVSTSGVNSTLKGFSLGVNTKHPITGDTVPIYVADYVISDYGHAAVMGVPAHDERDYQFAKEHGIDVRKVVEQEVEEETKNNSQEEAEAETFSGKGVLINSGNEFNGLKSDDAIISIGEYLYKNHVGGPSIQYKLRDWLVSRQRYWGAPIPMIHCETCETTIPVPNNELPVTLPSMHSSVIVANDGGCEDDYNDDETTEYTSDGSIKTPLTNFSEWNNVKCPECNHMNSKRDPDTLDTFVDSSWYFLRYCDPANMNQAFSTESVSKWMNKHPKPAVDVYIGGIEHAILHLLYARYKYKYIFNFIIFLISR